MAIASKSNNRPVLPPGYYLTNFLTLLDYVLEQYHDLLYASEIDLVTAFKNLTPDAQRLYVRLINRKGPYFRLDKLKYAEIKNTEQTVNELENRQFLLVNPRVELKFALQVLIRSELVDLARNLENSSILDNFCRSGKQDLINALLEIEEDVIWEHLEKNWQFLIPMHTGIVSLFFLLFFGNMGQSMSDFILEDIGVLRYESYEIRKEDRLFTDRKVIDGYIEIHNLRLMLWEAMEQKNIDQVRDIGTLLKEYNPPELLVRKVEKSYNEIAGFFERQKEWDQALCYYQLSSIPPSRERRARILDKIGEIGEALDLTNRVLAEPENENEQEFAVQFIEKLKRKTGMPCQVISPEKFVEEEIILERVQGKNIELAALEYFTSNNMLGFMSENGIWTALFGLVFWDIIFMPLPGVFFNPYQRGPIDLFSPEFIERRKTEIDHRIDEFARDAKWKKKILDCYDKKRNTANLLVPWKKIEREHIEKVISWIPKKHILLILKRMAGKLKEFRSGFPDLILYDSESNQYTLLEVKGPGDQLRTNQKRWLRFFYENEIPYSVVRIKWQE